MKIYPPPDEIEDGNLKANAFLKLDVESNKNSETNKIISQNNYTNLMLQTIGSQLVRIGEKVEEIDSSIKEKSEADISGIQTPIIMTPNDYVLNHSLWYKKYKRESGWPLDI